MGAEAAIQRNGEDQWALLHWYLCWPGTAAPKGGAEGTDRYGYDRGV